MIAELDLDRAVAALRTAGLAVRQPPEDWLVKLDTDGVVVDVLFRRHAGRL
ncbi:MAG: hypothetical protein JO147_02270 [Actinobacteria bacterium]|nr:hypothetical protein [Actinomycetota bacterium]